MIGGAKGIGLGIDLGLVNQYNRTGSQSYIEPEVLDSLVGVWSAYGMTNDSPNRSTIKNKLSNKGGDFVISNAAFKLNSGFGKYEVDFTSWIQTNGVIASSDKVQNSIIGRFLYFNTVNKKEDVPSFKVNITLGQQGKLQYNYIKEDGTSKYIVYSESGIYTIPASYFSKYTGGNAWFGFYQIEGTSIIEQIPSLEGAFVTDGIDDLITSTKTVQEMGITDEVTVVSMIHQIDLNSTYTIATTNYIETSNSKEHVRSDVYNYGKTGIYGYSASLINNTKSDIKNILGDEADYCVKSTNSLQTIFDAKFSVVGRISKLTEASQVAWYWTIIANKVLTTDQINQVIAYFNLDRTLNPDILCNTIKQGITNENHAEFGDKLIDYSGNGRDIQLNNLAWDGDSGIGKYNYPNWKVTATIANTYSTIVNYPTVNGTYSINVNGVSELMQSIGLHLEIKYTTSTGIIYNDIKQDGVYSYILPDGATNLTLRFGGIPGIVNEPCNITITQIPSHAGGLCLDGVNDFGKVTGMPIYKDYTIVVDYERISGIEQAWAEALISKSYIANQGAFVLMETNGMAKHSYSFGGYTTFNKDDSTRTLLYQSKYKCGDVDLNAGTGIDGDTLWLGTYRDNYSSFFNGAIYSLMSFPYSMSEFLIERQLKKHKLGTLYPDMVEFRPVIKHDDRITAIKYYHIKGSSWIDLKPGDYISVGSKISITTNLKSPYTIANVMSSSLTDIKVVPSAGGGNAYDILGYVTDKSPQKITMDIQVDSSFVQWNPIVESNVPYKSVKYYKLVDTSWKAINVGDYVLVGQRILTQITTVGIEDEVVAAVSEQLDIYGINKNSNGEYNILGITSSTTPQNINITIDEYIRYEDIAQPYPVLLRFKDENGNEVSWGGKFRVGSTITRIGSAADSNLLPNIYNIFGLLLNGNQVTSSKVIVEKTMVFKAKSAYIFDNNEPKCILSPRLLRIPNSSYKILGYIPDISGHGNNGVINNSAYAEGSGVNEDGSYQLDGVDDFVTIPTIAGKQVLIKLNWQNKAIGNLIYDQRDNGSTTSFAIMPANISDTTNNRIAYQARNANGITYIDGIRNEYIESYSLENIIHNITITNPDVSNKTVALGASNRTTADYFAKYALYDFMLFDEISTDDKIKELNEYVGIEAKVELPPYYWDTYGKTNSDADRDTIQQRGVAVGDYDLTNTNFAYDKMSGFGGYEFEKFTDTTKWIETKREDGIEVIEKNDYSFTAKKVGTGQYFWDFKNNRIKTLDRDLTVKAISNNNVYIRWEFKYRTAEKPDIDSTIILLIQAMTPNVPITVTLPYKTQEEQTELGVVEGSAYYLFYFDPSDIPVGDEYTVEMLPLYTNGLVYDGITDYSKNANIPALDDFTAIIKREWLKKQGCPLIKGSKVYEGGNGNALLLEWDKAYNFVFYKRTDIMEGELPDNISFITPTNYNGNVITRGSEQDTNGICIAGDGNAGFANMVFYKLILYPKTIPLLQINFLKNLMERDEIIDLNNPIFIQE